MPFPISAMGYFPRSPVETVFFRELILAIDFPADFPSPMARKPSSGPTLDQIAQRLGLSLATASRAIRNAEGIHPDTCARVLKLARELGYALPQRRNGTGAAPQRHQIMVLSQCSTQSPDRHYLAGMSRASIPLKIVLMAHHLEEEDCPKILSPQTQPMAMQEGALDGLVLLRRWPSGVVAQLSAKWPTVSIVHDYPDCPVDMVGIDDRGGIGQIVTHLIRGGHRKIGFFGLCPDVRWSCSRHAAYVEAITRAGFPYQPEDVIGLTSAEALAVYGFTESGPVEKALARLRDGVDAWVCASMGIGWSLTRSLLERGIRIPEDVAVTGYHKNMEDPRDLPPLTTTDILDEELGAAALRLLLHRFEFPRDAKRMLLLSAPLLVRGTTRNCAPGG